MPAAGYVIEFVAKNAVAVGGQQMQQEPRRNNQSDHRKATGIPAGRTLAIV